MKGSAGQHCIAFEGARCIGHGALREIAWRIREASERGDGQLLVFDDATSEPVELDLRGSEDEILARLEAADTSTQSSQDGDAAAPSTPVPRPRGRPRLGVIAREVTLLPRHWEWLEGQSGGASVALRRLVEQARRDGARGERVRLAREAAYRFIAAIAGNLEGFEDAARALFAGDAQAFAQAASRWPKDVRAHAMRLFERTVDDQQANEERAVT
ncbi:MAG: DUF2239 family protein [Gammaproteobacteria bacterium]